jgi:crotonobetainyl-CoA:carnitine CoA-transferase CaiB-like acyl-CoA transferase
MATDPRFLTVQDRRANQDEIIATVSAFTRQRTKPELLRHFGGKVPFSPVYNVRDIVADPHFKAREMLPWVRIPASITTSRSPASRSR